MEEGDESRDTRNASLEPGKVEEVCSLLELPATSTGLPTVWFQVSGTQLHEVQGEQIRTLQVGWGSLAPLRKMETLWRILSRG